MDATSFALQHAFIERRTFDGPLDSNSHGTFFRWSHMSYDNILQQELHERGNVLKFFEVDTLERETRINQFLAKMVKNLNDFFGPNLNDLASQFTEYHVYILSREKPSKSCSPNKFELYVSAEN